MTTDHHRQAHKDALHACGGQSNRWDGCNLAGGKPLPVTQPKNRALFFLVLPRRNQPRTLSIFSSCCRWLTASKLSVTAVFESFWTNSKSASVWPAPRFAASAALK